MSDPYQASLFSADSDYSRAIEEPELEPDLTLEERFERFHAANPHVYRMLLAECRRVRASGRTRWSMRGVFEVVRWKRFFTVQGDTFKLNNNWTPFYARRIMEADPSLAGFFELRSSKYQEGVA